jgi:hypothetical protein
MPVGLENERNPLGHSGQRKLQLVVGSTDICIGIPQCLSFFATLENQKLKRNLNAFKTLPRVNNLKIIAAFLNINA